MSDAADARALRSLASWRAEVLAQVGALEPIGLSLLDALDQVLAEDVVAAGTPAADRGDAGRDDGPVGSEGEDVGEVLVPRGRRLRAADLAVLVAAGRHRVAAHPPPRVGVLAVSDAPQPGDQAQHAEPAGGAAAARGLDVNSVTLAAMAREAAARSQRLPSVPAEPRAIAEAVEGALTHSDLLVVAGSRAGLGPAQIAHALAGAGHLEAAHVGLDPAPEQGFGLIYAEPDRPVPVLVVPGDALGAAVSFEVLVRPAIRLLQGRRDLNRARVSAVLEAPLHSAPDMVGFVPVMLERREGVWTARPALRRSRDALAPLAPAHGLAEVPAEVARREVDETVLVHLLVDPG